MSLDTRLHQATTALETQVDPEPAPIASLRRRLRRRRTATAGVALVAIALGAIAALRTADESRERGVQIGSNPPQQSERDPDRGPASDSPRPETTRLEYHGLSTDVPDGWTIERHRCPSGRDGTITLGAPKGKSCAIPATKTSWVWLRPLEDPALVGTTGGCTPGYSGSLRGCQIFDNKIDTWFVEDLDVVLVTHSSGRTSPGRESLGAWRYSDPVLRLASRSGRIDFPQPLFVVQAFVEASLTGNCPRLETLADDRFTPSCAPIDPNDGIVSAGLGKPSSVVTGAGREFHVTTETRFDIAERRVATVVTGMTLVSSDAVVSPLLVPSRHLDDSSCAPVPNNQGVVVGCHKAEDTKRMLDAMIVGKDPGAIPVYAGPTSDEIVGYSVPFLPYIPLSLANDIDRIRICHDKLQDPTSEIGPRCTELLLALGIPADQLENGPHLPR